jgi:hypothetical protein
MDRRIAKAKENKVFPSAINHLSKGVSHIEMNGLAIIPEQRDTLLSCKHSVWSLTSGSFRRTPGSKRCTYSTN